MLRRHPLADGLPVHHEIPSHVILSTDMSETQKMERFRLPLPTLCPPYSGIAPEFNQARFLRVQLQPELSQPLL